MRRPIGAKVVGTFSDVGVVCRLPTWDVYLRIESVVVSEIGGAVGGIGIRWWD